MSAVHANLFPCSLLSANAFTCTTIDEFPAFIISDLHLTQSPRKTGSLNSTLSKARDTAPQASVSYKNSDAAFAAARSSHANIYPPNKVPAVLICVGCTSSEYSDILFTVLI